MNGWHQGDSVHMDSTIYSLCKSHTSCVFSPQLLWEMALQCHKGYHNSAIPCDESTALSELWFGGQKCRKNRSQICQMLRAITLHGLRGKWKHWVLFGMCPSDFKHTHFNTTSLLGSLSEANGTTIKDFFPPIDIILSLHLTYLNKTCRNTWFSRADLTTVMFEAGMKKPLADPASSQTAHIKESLRESTAKAATECWLSAPVVTVPLWNVTSPWHSWQILSHRHFWKRLY